GLLRAGHVYVVPPSPVLGVDKRVRLPLLVGELERLDTVAWLPNPPGLFIPDVGAWAFDPVPTSPLAGVSPRGSGAAVVSWDDDESGVLRVQSFGADGELRWQRDFKVPRTRIPNAVRDSLLE